MRKQDPKNLGRTIMAIVLAVWMLAAAVLIISDCSTQRQEINRTPLDQKPGEVLYMLRYDNGDLGYTWEPEGGTND